MPNVDDVLLQAILGSDAVDINLFEVSIIDNRKMPAYIGKSIETRAEGECAVQYRAVDVNPKVVDLRSKEETPETPSENYYKTLEKNIEILNFGGK